MFCFYVYFLLTPADYNVSDGKVKANYRKLKVIW